MTENVIRTIVHFDSFLVKSLFCDIFFAAHFLLTFMNLIVFVTFLHLERAFVFCVTLSTPRVSSSPT